MFKVEAVVIGAGVVGLAISRALATRGVQVLVLEKEGIAGTGTSSRNSEVIHSGIYYEPASLKARLCVDGRRMLYTYCRERGIAQQQCGKLIVATCPNEETYLDQLMRRGKINGVGNIEIIGATQLKSLEPQLRATSALLLSCTGIVDSHALMLSLQADVEAAGGTVAFHATVVGGDMAGQKVQLKTGGTQAAQLESDFVINAAGLAAWEVSASFSGLDPTKIPPKHLAKGNYFILVGARSPFSHLVYPVPEPGGLGIHLTLDLAGQARFGPDVEWVDRIDYAVDTNRAHLFYNAIRRYWPGLPDCSLAPAYSGIRAKTVVNGQSDFVIQGPERTGHRGYAALYGIESPGLTSALAIGEHVAEMVTIA